MSRYERNKDKFLSTNADGSFRMKSTPQQWHRRAESFGTFQGHIIFGRRMELVLRAALDAPTEAREGIRSVIKDVLIVPKGLIPIRSSLQADLSSLIANASIVDGGAGTDSLLSFIEWAGLPYPRQITLIEPTDEYYNFLQDRLEGKVNTSTKNHLSIENKELHDRHGQVEHVVYVARDNKTGNESQIQLIHSTVETRNIPVISPADAIIFVGVSKYYKPQDFKYLVEHAQMQFQGESGGITSFNTQGKKGTLPQRTGRVEQTAYLGAKALHQLAISGRPTLHNFYRKEDIEQFSGKAKIVHNYGFSIIVSLDTR